MSFRIMPAQRLDQVKTSCLRWGFIIHGHPRGDRRSGRYIASWETMDEALAAASALGMDPHLVESVSYIVPEED